MNLIFYCVYVKHTLEVAKKGLPSIPAREINHETELEQFASLAEQRHQSIFEAVMRNSPNEHLRKMHFFIYLVVLTTSKTLRF